MIAIISDVHGNHVALQEVLNKIDSLGIMDIYCLGDVVGYYSQVNECCDELRKRNIQCVMGNHDWYMASGTDCSRSKSVRDCMAYQRRIITAENLDWVRSFRTTMVVQGIFMVHGGWKNPIDEYLEPSQEYFSAIRGRFFASGHTHIQRVEDYDDKVYCNPGSVGQPRDGDNRAAFATFDSGSFKLYRVPYNTDTVGKLMDAAGFNPYYYGCLRDASQNLHT
ncbi:MAG: metallophosphatase family protein [Odoribacter sp.]|nr:metallophosphatase family protein [Odoribacter sp.]